MRKLLRLGFAALMAWVGFTGVPSINIRVDLETKMKLQMHVEESRGEASGVGVSGE